MALFETEVQLTCQLTSPHTVSVYDYGVSPEGLFYFVMEYLDGVTLGHLVKNCGPQPAARVIHFLRQVCSSLAEAHTFGLIHRDLKPDNLMVCSRGGVPDTIKVLDFGLATVVSKFPERDQVSAKMCGTPDYMSPESIAAPQTVDSRSDLYSLGAVGYFLLTGKTVFPAKNINALFQSHLNDVPQRPSERLGTPIDDDLQDLILRCLSKSPDKRPASPEELSRLLGRCQSADKWNPQDAVMHSVFRQVIPQRKVPVSESHECLQDTHVLRPV